MRFRWEYLLVLCLLPCPSFAGQGKPTHGDVSDADSLLKVRTFCLDSSQLTARELTDLERFAAQAGKPKGVLTKLHWQRADSCRNADATVKLTMDEYQGLGSSGNGTSLQNPTAALKAETYSRAKMFITDRASGKTLYKVEGKEFTDDRQSAFEDTFSKLSKDLKALAK